MEPAAPITGKQSINRTDFFALFLVFAFLEGVVFLFQPGMLVGAVITVALTAVFSVLFWNRYGKEQPAPAPEPAQSVPPTESAPSTAQQEGKALAYAEAMLEMERQQREVKKQMQEVEKYKRAFDQSGEHIIITDPDAKIIAVNKTAERLTGYTMQEMIGKTPALWGKQMDPSFYKAFWHRIKEEKLPFIGEITNRRKDGTLYQVQTIVSPILNENREVEFFVGVERDITEEKELDRLRSEFISLGTHQLRAPLATINWSSELLLSGDEGVLSEEAKKSVQDIQDAQKRLHYILTALLNASRVETGRLAVSPRETDAAAVLQKVIRQVEDSARAKNITISFTPTPGLPTVVTDPSLLEYIYLALITNAIKYSPQSTQISISVEKNDGVIESTVADQGYGIPADQQDKVFTKFFQGRNVLNLKEMTTGLGLYLVKSVTELLGGTARFTSTENEGTSFTFTVPLAGSPRRPGPVGLEY